jgi:Anti-sigma-K factor rskA
LATKRAKSGAIMADDQFNELDVRVDAALASGSTWTQPPADLRVDANDVGDDVVDTDVADTDVADADVDSEAKMLPRSAVRRNSNTSNDDANNVVDLVTERKRRGPHWLVAAAVGAAAAIVGTLGITQLRTTKVTTDATATLAATAAYPGVNGSATMRETSSGWEFRLSTANLTRLEKPFFYEAWIEGNKGLIPIGTFHTGVDVILWGGVELDEYPKIVITKEQEDGNPAASDDRVLVGDVVFRKK